MNNNQSGPYSYILYELIEFNKKQQRLINQKELEEIIKEEEDKNKIESFQGINYMNNNVLCFMPSKEQYEKYYQEQRKKLEFEENIKYNDPYIYIQHNITKDLFKKRGNKKIY